jgi:hypothetical protein
MKTKILKLLIALLFIGCSSINTKNMTFIDYLSEKEFDFSDSVYRNLTIRFLNDSVLKVHNTVRKSHGLTGKNDHFFSVYYKIKSVGCCRYQVGDIISSSIPLYKSNYIHPYRGGTFYTATDIFPIITNDTIFIMNERLSAFLIKDFTFYEKK